MKKKTYKTIAKLKISFAILAFKFSATSIQIPNIKFGKPRKKIELHISCFLVFVKDPILKDINCNINNLRFSNLSLVFPLCVPLLIIIKILFLLNSFIISFFFLLIFICFKYFFFYYLGCVQKLSYDQEVTSSSQETTLDRNAR